MSSAKLLMVDNEPEIGVLVRRLAESVGYEMQFTEDGEEFKSIHRSFDPDVIILDLAMPGTDGIELLAFLADESCQAKILLMSGYDPKFRAMAYGLGEARGLEMAGIIPKPVRVSELRSIHRNSGLDSPPRTPDRRSAAS